LPKEAAAKAKRTPKALAQAAPEATPREPKSKLAEQIATRIAQHIIDIGWPVGKMLGNEADLASQFGVSRWIIREAISIVERDGLVTMKRGRNGGLLVSAPAADAVGGVIRSYLAFANPTLEDLGFARRELEEYMVRRVNDHMQPEQVDDLRALIVDTVAESEDKLALLGIAMMRKLLEVANNPALRLFTLTLSNLTITASWRTQSRQPMVREILRCRREQIDFLIAGDLARALEKQTEHLSLSHWRLGGGPSSTPKANLRQRAFEWFIAELDAPTQMKLPQRLAYQIQDDILELNCPIGTHLGLEAELLRKYNVSRAVFREAVRALERLGVVEMRTGHNSGLKVASPNPRSTVESASRYLHYLQTPPASMIELLGVLELSAAELLFHAPGRLEELSQKLASQEPGTHDSINSILDHCSAVDMALAKAIDNQIISVFLEILIETLRVPEEADTPRIGAAGEVAAIVAIEKEFRAALAAKDAPRARRLLIERRKKITPLHIAALERSPAMRAGPSTPALRRRSPRPSLVQ